MTKLLWCFFAVFIFCAFTDSQQNAEYIDEELMIEVPASQLYVRVRGNRQGPLLINLHGGPGGYSGIDISLMGEELEKKFLVAYLDQRGCGKSPACNDNSLLTIDRYTGDLDIVIDSLCNHLAKKRVNLIGTSWGGLYGFLYLLQNEKRVNAFACIDGKVNSEYQNNFLWEFQTKKVEEFLKTETDTDRRNELLMISGKLERIKNDSYTNFYENVNWMLHEASPALGFSAYFVDTSKIISTDEVLRDTALLELMHYSAEEYLCIGEKAEFVNQAFLNGNEYNLINIEDELSQIGIPVAVIQGEFDYVVGTGHADLIYNALSGLPPELKELHILPDTGHCPAIECPEVLMPILMRFFGRFNR